MSRARDARDELFAHAFERRARELAKWIQPVEPCTPRFDDVGRRGSIEGELAVFECELIRDA